MFEWENSIRLFNPDLFSEKAAVKVPITFASSLIFKDSFSRWQIHVFYIFYFLSYVTLSNMFADLNVNPRYVIFCEGKELLLPGFIITVVSLKISLLL